MSDDHPTEPTPDAQPPPDRELSEAEEAGVRRLLAEARHDGPIPADVAARLDDVLMGLGRGERGDERGVEPPRPAGVTDLGSRRRRAGRLLVAAAAAVVVGVGFGAVHDHLGGPAGFGSAGSGSATSSSAGSSSAGSTAGEDAVGGSGASGARGPAHLPHALGRPVRLAPDRFAEQVRRLRRDGRAGADGSTCVPGGLAGAALVPVRYGRDPGLLAFRPPVGDSQVVDLYLCGQDRPVRSVTLPAR